MVRARMYVCVSVHRMAKPERKLFTFSFRFVEIRWNAGVMKSTFLSPPSTLLHKRVNSPIHEILKKQQK